MSRGLFVTGADTNVGKTYVAAMIVRALCKQGCRVGVYKPVASGSTPSVATDGQVLWEAAGRPKTLRDVCPQTFAAPLAPHLAARAEGQQVDAPLLRKGVDTWRADSDVVVVEGAGGFFSPISDVDLNADVARDLGYPLVIVARNALGCLNQVLLALHAARTYESGMPVAAVVLCDTSPPDGDTSRAANLREVRSLCAARDRNVRVTHVGWNASAFSDSMDWRALAGP